MEETSSVTGMSPASEGRRSSAHYNESQMGVSNGAQHGYFRFLSQWKLDGPDQNGHFPAICTMYDAYVRIGPEAQH
jgi:hypothetical protein